MRTPLVRLDVPEAPAEIWLKLECLQPIGSFKIRGAVNAIRQASPEELARGVVTTSAGNMAQGVAWAAREAGVPATIVVPDHAPEGKLAAVVRLGGRIVKVPYEKWWEVMEAGHYEGADGLFVHPVQNDLVMAGNGTIGLELLEDLATFDSVLIPYGGGGLTTGIASALRALAPEVRVYAVEPETGAPAAAALAAGGEPAPIDYHASFVDGAGGRSVLPSMWPLLSESVRESIVTPLADVASAMRLVAERCHVIAEGAAGCAVAAALTGRPGAGITRRPVKVACVVSGGNIDLPKFAALIGACS